MTNPSEPDPTRWFGDPAAAHEVFAEPDGAGFRPRCSCGFRAPLTSETEEDALRRAHIHAAVSSPEPGGRYVLTAGLDPGDDAPVTIGLSCSEHPDRLLLAVPTPAWDHEDEIAAAMRVHEREHGGD